MQQSTAPDVALDMPKVVFYLTTTWIVASGMAHSLLSAIDITFIEANAPLSPLLGVSPYITLAALPIPLLVGWSMGLRGADDWVRAGILVVITALAPIAWLWLAATLVAPEMPNSPLLRGLRRLRAQASGHPL